MKAIPARLLRHIKSRRLRRLVQEVSARVPAHDRHMLSARLGEITDDPTGRVSPYAETESMRNGRDLETFGRYQRAHPLTG